MLDSANRGEVPPNTVLEDICQILMAKKIVKERRVQVDEVMIDSANRGTLGVNAHNVHRNGNQVDAVGVDMKELNKSMCFEVVPIEPYKSETIAFNEKQIVKAKGMLAPLTGNEHVTASSTNHWTQWVRAVKYGCRTPYKKLQDQSGCLSAERFRKKDKRMGVCMDDGWDWRVFPWQCRFAWPGLPEFMQRTLNSSHSVTSKSTELEVMVGFAESDDQRDDKASFDEIVEGFRVCGPACAPYIEHVATLARRIGGGKHAPVLYFLDRISKEYGENKMLGEEFVVAAAAFEVSKTEKVAFLRAALVAANLVTDKVVDGFSRLIVKTDVEKLKGKDAKPRSVEVDQSIGRVWNIVEKAKDDGVISEEQGDLLVGRFMMRNVLVLIDKQKWGPEPTRKFADTKEVKDEFIVDLTTYAREDLEITDADLDGLLGDWVPSAGHAAAPAPAAEPRGTKRAASVLSAAEQNDPVRIFGEHGFNIGDRVREKGVQDVYTIMECGEKITLKIYDQFGKNKLKAMIPLATFLDKWSVYKGNLSQVLPPQAAAAQHDHMSMDYLRCRVFNALLDHETTHTTSVTEESLDFMIYPHGIVAKKTIARGVLKLAPLAPLSNIYGDQKNQSVAITVEGKKVYVTSTGKPRDTDEKELGKHIYVPFWWVEGIPDESIVNMKLVGTKADDITIPVLQNTRAIKLHERLYVYKPKDAKVVLKDAEVMAAKRIRNKAKDAD